jgi:hypothetical protein
MHSLAGVLSSICYKSSMKLVPRLIRDVSAPSHCASYFLMHCSLLVFILVLANPAIGQDNDPGDSLPDERLKSEFAGIAADLYTSTDPFLGRGQLEERERRLSAASDLAGPLRLGARNN